MTQHAAAKAAAEYVQGVRLLDCAIEGLVVEHLQKDMAARRQADRSIGGQHFHIWLSVGAFSSNYFSIPVIAFIKATHSIVKRLFHGHCFPCLKELPFPCHAAHHGHCVLLVWPVSSQGC